MNFDALIKLGIAQLLLGGALGIFIAQNKWGEALIAGALIIFAAAANATDES